MLLGIINDVRLLQPENALPPIEVTLLGIAIEVKLLQSENAPSRIVVRVLGKDTDVNDEHPLNAAL